MLIKKTLNKLNALNLQNNLIDDCSIDSVHFTHWPSIKILNLSKENII